MMDPVNLFDIIVTWFAFKFGALWVWLVSTFPTVGLVLEKFSEPINDVFAVLGSKIQPLLTLAGISFGIYKWWDNREARLMRRFMLVLQERDKRLADARQELSAFISIPGPTKPITQPLFAVKPLASVLKRRNWHPRLRRLLVWLEQRTDKRLERAAERLDWLIKHGEALIASRRSELFTAHLLRGALATSRAARFQSLDLQNADNNPARRHFENALEVPGFRKDWLGRECVGLQLIKLDKLDAADEVFASLDEDAMMVLDQRERAIKIGRASHHRALVDIRHDLGGPSANANGHLIRATQNLDARGPYDDRRVQFEYARTHEVHWCVRRHLPFPIVTAVSLEAAKANYKKLENDLEADRRWTDQLRWFVPYIRRRCRENQLLRREAKEGLARLGGDRCVCGGMHTNSAH
jgi:hypothetical protein